LQCLRVDSCLSETAVRVLVHFLPHCYSLKWLQCNLATLDPCLLDVAVATPCLQEFCLGLSPLPGQNTCIDFLTQIKLAWKQLQILRLPEYLVARFDHALKTDTPHIDVC